MKTLIKLTLIVFLSLGTTILKAQNVVTDSVEYKLLTMNYPTAMAASLTDFWIELEDNDNGTVVIAKGIKGRDVAHYSSITAALKSYTSKGWRVHTMAANPMPQSPGFVFLLERKKQFK
jgi:hypothetical protein